jgi:hypothetical protein
MTEDYPGDYERELRDEQPDSDPLCFVKFHLSLVKIDIPTYPQVLARFPWFKPPFLSNHSAS